MAVPEENNFFDLGTRSTNFLRQKEAFTEQHGVVETASEN